MTLVDRAPGRGWDHFTGGISTGYRTDRDDTVSVTLAARSESLPREAFVQHAYPLDAADVAWLRDRLTEAHAAMTGATARGFDSLDSQVADDSVQAVEDAIDTHFTPRGDFTGDQGPAVVRALLELGWTPPAVTR